MSYPDNQLIQAIWNSRGIIIIIWEFLQFSNFHWSSRLTCSADLCLDLNSRLNSSCPWSRFSYRLSLILTGCHIEIITKLLMTTDGTSQNIGQFICLLRSIMRHNILFTTRVQTKYLTNATSNLSTANIFLIRTNRKSSLMLLYWSSAVLIDLNSRSESLQTDPTLSNWILSIVYND